MDQLEFRAIETESNLRVILKLEAAAPFTQNTHYLAEKRDKHLSHYKDARAGRVSAERSTPAPRPAAETTLPFGFSSSLSSTMAFPSSASFIYLLIPMRRC